MAGGAQAAGHLEHLATSGHEFQKIAKKAQAAVKATEEGGSVPLAEPFELDSLEGMSTAFPPTWEKALTHLSSTGTTILGAEKVRLNKMYEVLEKTMGGMPSSKYSKKKSVWSDGLNGSTMDATLTPSAAK